jgi:hypothetical protein
MPLPAMLNREKAMERPSGDHAGTTQDGSSVSRTAFSFPSCLM